MHSCLCSEHLGSLSWSPSVEAGNQLEKVQRTHRYAKRSLNVVSCFGMRDKVLRVYYFAEPGDGPMWNR